MDGKRFLIVTADDFGIGDPTSRAILDLTEQGRVTCTVLLVNSPHAESAVNMWRCAGRSIELGWHPCLTLDRPIAPAAQVPSLVDPTGAFWNLGQFMRRIALGRIRREEVEIELRAQYVRFQNLVGRSPTVVNAHHHVQVFAAVSDVLQRVLARQSPYPYLRRVCEPWQTIRLVPGARLKRVFLSILGRGNAARQREYGYPGADWLAGITDPACVADPNFLARWLACIPGNVVELTCHPGHHDSSLIGRDCTPNDGQLKRRVDEYRHLSSPEFLAACKAAGFELISPASLSRYLSNVPAQAA